MIEMMSFAPYLMRKAIVNEDYDHHSHAQPIYVEKGSYRLRKSLDDFLHARPHNL